MDIVYFDLETQRTANDAGGWNKKRDMGMSVGVTYSTKLCQYRIYSEQRVNDLVNQLLRADLVVGFNICLLYTSPSPRDLSTSRMPSSA